MNAMLPALIHPIPCHAARLMLAMVCFTMHVSDALVPSDLAPSSSRGLTLPESYANIVWWNQESEQPMFRKKNGEKQKKTA
jgi:hypothetical protein